MRRVASLGVLFVVGCTSSSSTAPSQTYDAGPSPTVDSGAGVDARAPGDAGGSVDAGVDVAVDAAPACPIPVDATVPATIRFTADNERLVYLNGALVEDNSALGWQTVSQLPVALRRNPTVPNVLAIRGRNTSSQAGADRGILVELSWAGVGGDAGDGGD